MERMGNAATFDPIEPVHDRLRRAREAQGWTQKEMVMRSGGRLKLRTITNYEKPGYTGRKEATVWIWADLTGWPYHWLWSGTEIESESPAMLGFSRSRWIVSDSAA